MSEAPKVKCVVWDLDNTLWQGILAEGDTLTVRPEAHQAIRLFDERGILQSVASRNDAEPALQRLKGEGLEEFFLYPQINWGPKSASIEALAQILNIGLDTIVLIDDQAFERDEVRHVLPAVRVYDPVELAMIPDLVEFIPRYLTDDSRKRRAMYQAEAVRKEVRQSFKGTEEAFLQSLDMRLSLAPAQPEDLRRAEELTLRTNQLNTTGVTYTADELRQLMLDPAHRVLMADLTDRYGEYGKIGLILLSCQDKAWTIELLLMSCRVMSRGAGGVIINLLRHEARRRGLRLLARFKQTDRNRMMYVTYRFAGFSEVEQGAESDLLENDLSSIPSLPGYVALALSPELGWGRDE